MDGKGDLHSQNHPLPRGVCAHQAREGELIRFTTFFVTTLRGTVGVRPLLDLGPGNGPRPPQSLAAYRDKEIGRASGKRGWPGTCGTSPEELVGLSLFDEATVVEEKRAIVSAMQQRLGEKNPPRRADVALDAVEQRSLASFFDDQLCRPRHRPRAGHDFLNVDPAEWSGRDDYTTARRRARHLRGGERLCGEGRRPHQRVLRRHHARRGTATAPSAGRGAPPGVVPVREIVWTTAAWRRPRVLPQGSWLGQVDASCRELLGMGKEPAWGLTRGDPREWRRRMGKDPGGQVWSKKTAQLLLS
ncbi:hypothetical protein GWK47_022716 [Chionoecetes opilio]|uniref:Uncharacterized protein n=1 Tax=Chionoecetes opilio TaxID=41210 RepID=A0A8J4XNF1_CHIOP|nr:hypothetical protein GWK47_022716 [Chionoecetes opilio]